MPKLLFFVTEDWYFCSHRLPLARTAVNTGYEVVLVTNVQSHGDLIRSQGIRLIPLALKRRSLNPFRELVTFLKIVNIYHKERPDIVHHVAVKPVLYGSVAARILGIVRVVNAFAGMGHIYASNGIKERLMRSLINLVLRLMSGKHARFILQNPDDIQLCLDQGVVDKSRAVLIKGAGVDVSLFSPFPEPAGMVTVILPARMLYYKGVVEFVSAARILKESIKCARFVLVGGNDPDNPASISENQLEGWHKEGTIEWWRHCDNMPTVFSQAHMVCLPSYY